MTSYDLGFDRELVLGILNRLEGLVGIKTANFEHDAARFDNCHIIFHITLTRTHAGLWWFVSIRFGRKNTNPNLPTTLHFADDRPAGSFDLPGGHPTGFQSLQAIFTEAHLCTTQSLASHPTAHLLAPLYTFWHQHNYYLIKSNFISRAWLFAHVDAFGCLRLFFSFRHSFAFVNPDFHT